MKRMLHLLAVLACWCGLYAQSPGGVGTPQLWFQTKPQVDTNLKGYYRWQDMSGNGQVLRYYHASGAAYGSEFMNTVVRYYNGFPALNLDFGNNLQNREVLLPYTSLSQATFFGVFAPSNYFNREVMLFGLNGGRAGQGVFIGSDKIYPSIESGKQPLDYGKEEGMDLLFENGEELNLNYYREKSMRIVSYYRSLPPVTSLWGEREQSTLTFNTTYLASNRNNTSTFSIPAASNLKFYGYIPEIIAYSRLLTPAERRKVDTYLAIKYGLSLPVSYIGSNDRLIWDIEANGTFNHRIAALLRDDDSGLCLREATTSYQDQPYYSDVYDYYNGNDPYQRSSFYRLLVMGRAHGNSMKNGDYLVWGDNNEPVSNATAELVAGIKTMPRHWLVHTNIETRPKDTLAFDTLDMQVQEVSPHCYQLTRAVNVSKSEWKTRSPLKGKNGYLSARFSHSSSYRCPFEITFGGEDYSYGYRLHTNGYLYKWINGTLTAPALALNTAKIEVEKDGKLIFLRVNGVRQPTFDILIPEENAEKDYYGRIVMEKSTAVAATLSEVRHGGFIDTGNKVELSYTLAPEFASYANAALKKAFLIIDRSGSGEFRSGDLEYIPLDEVDATRRKLIFNHVFWDTDGNGKDVFTFGYKPGSIVAEVLPEDPSCLHSLAQQDGNIRIIMKSGIKGYAYTLSNTESGESRIKEYFNDTIRIDSLYPGNYNLEIKEIGGTNFYQNPEVTTAQALAVTSTRFTTTTNAYLEWIAADTTTSATVAFMHYSRASGASVANATFDNGVRIEGGALYAIINKIQEAEPFAEIRPGDRIRIERYSNQLWFVVNGEQLTQRIVPTSGYIYGVVRVDNPEGELTNMKWNRINTGTVWSRTASLLTEVSTEDKVSIPIALQAPCDIPQKETEPEIPILPRMTEEGVRLEIEQTTDYSVKARMVLDKPEPVSFLIYNMQGALVRKAERKEPATIQEADLRTGMPGVYIVKALTESGEWTKEILIK